MKPALQSAPGGPGTAVLLSLLLCVSTLFPDEQAVLRVESRYESWKTGEAPESGRASSRLLLDYADLDGGLIASRREDGSCRLSGGLGLPWLKVGSLSLEGPLRELRSPPQAAPLSAVYEAHPSAGLDRGWSPASHYGLALGLPGRFWFSCTAAQEAIPEAAAAVEVEGARGLAASAVLLYSRLEAAGEDEWTLPQGMPPEGEILMGGLRLVKSGSAGGISGFAGTSLHPLLPAGYYLRGKVFLESRLIDAGGRLGWTNRWYRTPASVPPPCRAGGALEARLFPDFHISPTGSLSGELDHPPPDGSLGADWKGTAAAGGEIAVRYGTLSLERRLEMRRTDGEFLAEELLKGRVEAGTPFSPELHLSLESALRLGTGEPEALRLGLRYVGGGLRAEIWGGFSSGAEFGERNPERERASGIRVEFERDDWSLSLDAVVEEYTEWRLTGGRRFGGIK